MPRQQDGRASGSNQVYRNSAYRIEAEAALGTTLKSLDPGGPGNFLLVTDLAAP